MSYTRLAKDVIPGENILVDDGKIKLEVVETNSTDTVTTKVINGGILSSRKGVNLPNTKLSMPSLPEKDKKDGVLFKFNSTAASPARDSGEGLLVLDHVNMTQNPRKAWTYDPGERRVRRAPTLSFDTPDRAINTFDDHEMFNGSPEKYDWKLVGKKEMYVPYNNNNLNSTKHSFNDIHKVNFINSDLIRYELHRVWVIEGTVKQDERHLYARRTMYIDEDTWTGLVADKYDGKGNLWRVSFKYPVNAPEVPAIAGGFFLHHDLKTNGYLTFFTVSGQDKSYNFSKEPPSSQFFTPAALRRRGR